MEIIGPATVVSVAYIDPGNFGANIAAGSAFGLSLLWVVWLSGALAVMYQYIAGVLGLETGRGLLDHLKKGAGRLWPLYIPVLFAIGLSTDLAEFVGLIIAFELLTGVPLYIAVLLGSVDVLLLALLDNRKEVYFSAIGSLASIVGLSFLIELVLVRPDIYAVLYYSLVPSLKGSEALYAASIIGATIMPHALILHSHMTQGMEKRVHRVQTLYNLVMASAVNAAMQIVAATALYGDVGVGLSQIPRVLEPLYGPLAGYVFSIALLSSGLASSAVSVQAGTLMLERIFTKAPSKPRARLLFRGINVIPTALVLEAGLNPLSLLVYTQVVLSLVLPLVLIPLLIYASRYLSKGLAFAAYAASSLILFINVLTLVSPSS